MENVQSCDEKQKNDTAGEIIKPEQQLQQQENNQIEQKQQQSEDLLEKQQQEEQKGGEQQNFTETPGEIQLQSNREEQPQAAQVVGYQEVDDEEEDEDDDEERETSQKLVIDLPDEDEVEKVEDDDDDDVIALDDLPQEVAVAAVKTSEKVSPKPQNDLQAIITLSDGEEDVGPSEAASKPGKVQKRRSMGSSSVASGNEEEHYRLKRRKINVDGAPKMPLTGYVRYMNDRRESLRKEHPTKTSMEHTKMIGEEWQTLSSDVKASYLKAADTDKQRYVKELHSFLKSRPDILASEMAKNKKSKIAENNSSNPVAAAALTTSSSALGKNIVKEKQQTSETVKVSKENNNGTKEKMSRDVVVMPSTSQQANEKTVNEKIKRKRTPSPPTSTNNQQTAAYNSNLNASSSTTAISSSSASVTATPGEIPIFTNEFLEHNKVYDMELRSLRKSKTDLELQNSVLEKHVENMKFGVEKMITENNELEEKNRLLEVYLDKLKRKLAHALSSLPLPSAPNGATVENIDKYMQDLYKMSTSNSHGPATLNKAKDIIRKLDLQIQL